MSSCSCLSFKELTADYPAITSGMGEGWVRKQLALPIKQRHILGAYLQRAYEDKPKIKELQARLPGAANQDKLDLLLRIDWLSASVRPLNLLESCLIDLASERNLPTLLKELRAPEEEFYGALSVAYFASYFKERWKLELFPHISFAGKTKTPDLAADLNGRRIYVEVTTPGWAKILHDRTGEIVGLKEGAIGQILDEYEENFKDAIEQGIIREEPIIIALDCGRSEIDQDSVEAAIFGTAQIQMLIHKQTGALVDARLKRKEDGIKLVKGSEMISAILWSKWASWNDDSLVIGGHLTLNPNAKNKLTEQEISKLDLRSPY